MRENKKRRRDQIEKGRTRKAEKKEKDADGRMKELYTRDERERRRKGKGGPSNGGRRERRRR